MRTTNVLSNCARCLGRRFPTHTNSCAPPEPDSERRQLDSARAGLERYFVALRVASMCRLGGVARLDRTMIVTDGRCGHVQFITRPPPRGTADPPTAPQGAGCAGDRIGPRAAAYHFALWEGVPSLSAPAVVKSQESGVRSQEQVVGSTCTCVAR